MLKSVSTIENDSEKNINATAAAATNDFNLLIKRYTLQIECLLLRGEHNTCANSESTADEWNFRESILKCLYAKDVQYPKSKRDSIIDFDRTIIYSFKILHYWLHFWNL